MAHLSYKHFASTVFRSVAGHDRRCRVPSKTMMEKGLEWIGIFWIRRLRNRLLIWVGSRMIVLSESELGQAGCGGLIKRNKVYWD